MNACHYRERDKRGRFYGPASTIPDPWERFKSRFVVDPGGCHIWTAGRSMGYGMFWADGGKVRAHVYAFERKYGPVPKGMVLDHVVCDRKLCVNPDHLRACTIPENINRSPHANVGKKFCPQGHPYDDANTYRRNRGRQCRACHREQERNRKKEARA
jgi:hypothetical protein